MPPVNRADRLSEAFDRVSPFTVGVEEEVLLLDPGSLDVVAGPVAASVLARLGDDVSFKPELPAGQLEIVTRPAALVADVMGELAEGRRALAKACAGLALPVAIPVHPCSGALAELRDAPRYAWIAERYGSVARRQLVASLQIHVAVGGAERTLGVYNALRLLLPELIALSANAPFHEGVDTGLATVRPTLAGQLPRQGIPPAIPDWGWLAAELEWGERSGTLPETGSWWWELRPHLVHGTLEVRVPDVQSTVAQAAGVIAFVQALVATLAVAFDSGERAPEVAAWRLDEARWAALRYGLDGELPDVGSGEVRPVRARLSELVDRVEPEAVRLGGASFLKDTRALIRENGAIRQRRSAAQGDMRQMLAGLAGRFLEGC